MTLESIDILKYKLYIGFILHFDTSFAHSFFNFGFYGKH